LAYHCSLEKMMGCKSCGKGRSSAVQRARAAQRAKLKAEKIARAQARQQELQNAVSGTTQEAPVQPEAPSSEATVTAQPEPDPSGGVVISDGVLQAEAEGQEEAQA
jgi:hypothetical protein